jgi:hypothetical protein
MVCRSPRQGENYIMEEFDSIEEYVRKHNRFFKQSNLTLDDLDVYAKPLSNVDHATMALSRGSITEQEAFKVMQRSASELKAINKRLDKKYAA